jgi:hypothetical protein
MFSICIAAAPPRPTLAVPIAWSASATSTTTNCSDGCRSSKVGFDHGTICCCSWSRTSRVQTFRVGVHAPILWPKTSTRRRKKLQWRSWQSCCSGKGLICLVGPFQVCLFVVETVVTSNCGQFGRIRTNCSNNARPPPSDRWTRRPTVTKETRHWWGERRAGTPGKLTDAKRKKKFGHCCCYCCCGGWRPWVVPCAQWRTVFGPKYGCTMSRHGQRRPAWNGGVPVCHDVFLSRPKMECARQNSTKKHLDLRGCVVGNK